jgi:hypothetical protein
MRAMKFLILILCALPQLASAATYHGNFLVCASDDNNLKMTADLSDGRGEKAAAAVFNGKKLVFPEMLKGKVRNLFAFYPNKTTPLIVSEKGKKDAEILVKVDPARSHFQLVFDRKEPMIYQVAKFNATLSVKKLGVIEREVSCSQTKWEND